MTTAEITNHIISSASDEECRTINDACYARLKVLKQILAAKNAAMIKSGDKLKLRGLSPKIINGMTVEATAINNTTVTVRMPVDFRLGARSGVLTKVPLQCVEQVK